MGLRDRLADYLFGDVIAARIEAAAVTVRVDDSRGWDSLEPGPADRPWSERAEDLDDALVAWRKNFLIRRLVTLTRSYVVGNGIMVSSGHVGVERFIRKFWDHPQNRMERRLGPMCDELVRAGELFPTLFTNRIDGMSYVRFVPASRIRAIQTEKDDYEVELRYGELRNDSIELGWWNSPAHEEASLYEPGERLPSVMLHFAVNRPIGATRGESDLGVVLSWAKRYTAWLTDRVRLNRKRTRQGLLEIKIADNDMVETKRKQLHTDNPMEAGIYVHGPGEDVVMHGLNIRAGDVKDDGRALRLAVAGGANVALHYLGEGETTNYATAREMGEPTARFYTDRQTELGWFLCDLVEAAYRRKVAMGLARLPRGGDFKLVTNVTEVARADNEGLARAAREIVTALRDMREAGWIDDETAVRLAFKFAGEPLGEEEVARILAATEPAGEIAPDENSED